MLGLNFTQAGLGALIFALIVSLVAIFLIFAILGWIARRKGL